MESFKNIVLNSKSRSRKWISTSISEEHWETDIEKYCSTEYYAKDMFKKVLFKEILEHIPTRSILIDLAPYGVSQNMFNKTLHKNINYVNLTCRDHEDGLGYLLSAVGK